MIGGATGINVSLFHTGGTLAAQIASQFQGAPGELFKSSLAYLGVDPLGASRSSSTSSPALIVQRGSLKDVDMTPTEVEAL